MGVLSDIVAAPADAAERIGRSRVPSKEFRGIDAKGIDTVKLGTLHSLLTGEPFESLLPAYDPVFSVSDEDGPWVFVLPDALVRRLSALDKSEQAATSATWAQTEEIAGDGWTAGEVRELLEKVCVMAKRADSAGHSLFLWMSL